MFSVIIPVYNGEKHIDNAIESVLKQDLDDYEIIIVDDGSKDNTAAVLEKYRQSENIRIISQKNQGVSAARNRGMDEAKGSYFVFLDADDIWYPDHLSVMSSLIEKYPDAGLYGTFTRTHLVSGEYIEDCPFFRNRGDTVYLPDFFEAYHKDKSAKMFTVITTCISREAIEKAGGFPVGSPIGEDLELSLRVAAYFPVVLSNKKTALYNKENSSATKDISFDPEWSFFDTVDELYNDASIPSSKKKNLKKVMNWFTMRRVRHYCILGEKKKAWKHFFGICCLPYLLKDNIITFALLLMPTASVKKIFSARWKNKA